MSCEAGKFESTTHFVVAAQLGIPRVGTDLKRRAYPAIQMFTPN